jgi:predicted transcriptional regulator
MERDDLMVLVRVARRMLPADAERIEEFPSLRGSMIRASIERLRDMGLIYQDGQNWTATFEGLHLVDRRTEAIQMISEQFDQRLIEA